MTRVLLFCPTNRLERETINAIHGIQFSGTLDTMFTRDNPHGEYSAQNIIHNYLKAERIVKAEGYDYLFIVENDIIPPPDALEKLIALDADIAYGVYCFRRGKPIINIQTATNGESYGLPHNLKAWARVWGKVVPCTGLGFGCALIKRSVFDVLHMHSDSGGDADTQMAIDAKRLGLTLMADTSVICGHKRPDGVVIWPTQQGYETFGKKAPPELRAIVPNRDMAFWNSDDIPVIMRAGEKYEIEWEYAGSFVNAGMAAYA